MPRRFFELAIRARRRVTPASGRPGRGAARLTGRRQIGGELAQFSFRLAFMIDLAYVGIGAVGGAAVGRAAFPPDGHSPIQCKSEPSAPDSAVTSQHVGADSSAVGASRRVTVRTPPLPLRTR